MKYIVLLSILVCFLIAVVLSFGIGLYLKDLFFLAIGVLLIFAAILIFFECKKVKNDPFLYVDLATSNLVSLYLYRVNSTGIDDSIILTYLDHDAV